MGGSGPLLYLPWGMVDGNGGCHYLPSHVNVVDSLQEP